MRWPRVAVVALACAVGLSGCFSQPDSPPASAIQLPTPEQTFPAEPSPDRMVAGAVTDVKPPGFADAPGDDLAAYTGQRLRWTDCDGGYRCATFLTPLDWQDPGAQAITIAMKMRPASTGPYMGPLFVNPGGPGGSAQDYVVGFPTSGLEGFDIIGLDSRGSGESTPVVCGTGAQTDAYLNTDFTPDDQSERDALIAAQQAFNEECRQASGALLDHISTIEAIYDYDLARQLIGAEKLSFFGTSYGTFLGAVYAELYPTRIDKMVLDSAVNLQPDSDVIQAEGFDRSLRAFASWCASNDCGLGSSEQEVVDTIVAFINGLDAEPLPGDGSRMLTQSQAVSGLLLYFYFGSDVYQELSSLLQYTMTSGDGAYLLQVADSMNDRNSDGTYGSLAYSFPAISCADEGDDGVQAAFDDWTGRNSELAPIFGKLFGPDLTCPLWTAEPAESIDFTGKDAPPILIVQNTGDSATPYENAELMASELQSATLVTREAAGHGAYDSGSACLDWIVVDYLVNGTVPAEGTRCTDG